MYSYIARRGDISQNYYMSHVLTAILSLARHILQDFKYNVLLLV